MDPRRRASSENLIHDYPGVFFDMGERCWTKPLTWMCRRLARAPRLTFSPSWEPSFPRESTKPGAWIIAARSREAFE